MLTCPAPNWVSSALSSPATSLSSHFEQSTGSGSTVQSVLRPAFSAGYWQEVSSEASMRTTRYRVRFTVPRQEVCMSPERMASASLSAERMLTGPTCWKAG